MTEQEARLRFPRASQSFINANISTDVQSKVSVNQKLGRRRIPNKTEAEYALILEAMKRKGEILRYEYEGITLRFAGVRYTPDFVVIHAGIDRIRFIEVKGAFTGGKFERAIERFRHARTYWPEFTFELHQKTKAGWKQIL
jgi:hypothetical protein